MLADRLHALAPRWRTSVVSRSLLVFLYTISAVVGLLRDQRMTKLARSLYSRNSYVLQRVAIAWGVDVSRSLT